MNNNCEEEVKKIMDYCVEHHGGNLKQMFENIQAKQDRIEELDEECFKLIKHLQWALKKTGIDPNRGYRDSQRQNEAELCAFSSPKAKEFEKLRNRIEELEAKVKRLTARGIQDMQYEIKELQAELKEAQKRPEKVFYYEGSDLEAEELNKQYQRIKELEAELKVKEKQIEKLENELSNSNSLLEWFKRLEPDMCKACAFYNKTIKEIKTQLNTIHKKKREQAENIDKIVEVREKEVAQRVATECIKKLLETYNDKKSEPLPTIIPRACPSRSHYKERRQGFLSGLLIAKEAIAKKFEVDDE